VLQCLLHFKILLLKRGISKTILSKKSINSVAELYKAIFSSSQETFVKVVENIDWDALQTPEPIKKAIDLALANGYHTMALNITTKGLALFPEDTDLQKFARILAPPKVIRANVPPSVGLRESMKWLEENRAQYSGQWVAIKHGSLLGHASSRQELSEILTDLDSSNILITRIPDNISS